MEECFRIDSVSGEDIFGSIKLVPSVSSSVGEGHCSKRAMEIETTVSMAVMKA